MQPKLFKAMSEATPKFNSAVARGVAVDAMPYAARTLDHVFKTAAASFPEGFEYVKCERCTPEEELAVITDTKANQKKIDSGRLEMAESNFILHKFEFKWCGESFAPSYMYIPYSKQGGITHIREPAYTISPVLADLAFSVVKKGIFIPFTRDRLTFERMPFQYRNDEGLVNSYVIWSALHKYVADQRDKAGPTTCLPHYLFAKCGVHDAFKRYAKAEIVILDHEPDPAQYPPEIWETTMSARISPKGRESEKTPQSSEYVHRQLRLLIRKEHKTEVTDAMIVGFWYIVSFFPRRIDIRYINDPRVWCSILGLIIFQDETNEGKVLNSVNAHMESIGEYVDDLVRESLMAVDIYCDDIYEFFTYTMGCISDYLLNVNPASGYNKKLTVLNYVLLDAIKAIFHLTYNLRNPGKKGLNLKQIKQALGKHLSRSLMLNISTGHGEVSQITCPGDSLALKYTSNLVQQIDATGKRNPRAKGNVSDPSKFYHSSIISINNSHYLKRAEPTSRSNLNPFSIIGPDGKVTINEHLIPLMEQIDKITER